MARSITYREAINEAIAQEMERDERVIVMGEDNAGGAGAPGEDDAWGGVLGVTKGLYGRFPGRVLDTPISVSAFICTAVGAAPGVRGPSKIWMLSFSRSLGCWISGSSTRRLMSGRGFHSAHGLK